MQLCAFFLKLMVRIEKYVNTCHTIFILLLDCCRLVDTGTFSNEYNFDPLEFQWP